MSVMVGEVVIAVVAAVPSTVAAVAAWKSARNTKSNGQGTLPEMTERMLVDMQELKVVTNNTLLRQVKHEEDTDAHQAAATVREVKREAHQAAQEARWGDLDRTG